MLLLLPGEKHAHVSFRFSKNETRKEQTWSKLMPGNQAKQSTAKFSRTTPAKPQLHDQEIMFIV